MLDSGRSRRAPRRECRRRTATLHPGLSERRRRHVEALGAAVDAAIDALVEAPVEAPADTVVAAPAVAVIEAPVVAVVEAPVKAVIEAAVVAPVEGDAMSGVLSDEIRNSVDATRGQPLAARVLARKDELEEALAELGPYDTVERQAIETALMRVYALITCDLAHPPAIVARDLNRWLERNKHLAQDITRRKQEARLARLQGRSTEPQRGAGDER